MITPQHAQLMARYNAWQNRSLYREAGKLSEAERREDRGAFFGSIHATLSHLLCGDQSWMYRFTAGSTAKPPVATIAETATAYPEWNQLERQRVAFDAVIGEWATMLHPDGLQGDLTWYSGAMGREITRPKWELVTHFFNHQTHHRGQVHAMVTRFGGKPDDTDIPFMPG